ncbi:MAG: glycosyltransferase family 2 protein [Candidatus Marinimicrobia bacterium]|nr:glycosyltransferase family 2 protein [Candidatus Neomarinimicrobiota bacterium]MDD5581739.1 glycosyltransferase family 2 protein [Candidatus Neomarinimicrobiota bacterium]
MIKVSVIIPHYKGRAILQACLQSLTASTFLEKEILLVDNGTIDDSLEMVTKEFPHVRILQNEKNLGFAGGCNRGIYAAHGEYLLFLNNDTIHDPGWIEPLVEWLDTHPETASVMPKILSYSRRDWFDYSGAAGGLLDYYGYPFARGRLLDYIEQDHGQYNNPIEIFWSSGTAFMMRKKALEESGVFDETFFAHMEEIDLHWRLHLLNWKAFCIPASIIWHHSGWTLPPNSYRKKYLNHRNNLIMLLANYSYLSLLWIIPARFLLDVMSGGFALLQGDFKRIGALVAAYFWLLIHIPYLVKKHQKHQSLRRVSDAKIHRIMFKYPIPLTVYLFRKKRYSDLKLS